MPAQLKLYLVTFGFFIFAIFLGQAVAKEDYDTIAAIFFLVLLVMLVVVPGYEFFIALGITSPFILPLPFARNFPFFGLMLGVCIVKAVFSRSLQKSQEERPRCYNVAILMLFGWVLLRYLMNPVKPNIGMSIGTNVTGFRAFFNYGLCALFMVSLGFFIQTREQAVRLVRWVGILSALFTFVLMGAAMSGSLSVAQFLSMFGIFVGFFDTGFMRLVVLPLLGCTVIALCFLPNVFVVRPMTRRLLLVLGAASIFLGGSRAGMIGAFATVFACALVRRRVVPVTLVLTFMIGCLLIFRFVGEYYNFREGVGLLRVISLVSERAAELTDAGQTYKWRQARWERAIEDIKKDPVIGSSYGGLDNAYTFANRADYAVQSVDIDLASGSIHNGYLAGARAFGVPFCLLFIFILGSRIITHGIQSARLNRVDPALGDLHAFVFANLICQAFYIAIGSDLNNPVVWFCIALGFLVSHLKPAHAPAYHSQENTWRTQGRARPMLPEMPLPSLPR